MTKRQLVLRSMVVVLLSGHAGTGGAGQEELAVPRCGGWGPESAYGRMFDPATVETVRGEVVAIDLVNPRKGMACGVCLTLRTEEGPVSVHLGPECYINQQATRVEPHDAVHVTGSRVCLKGAPIIVATKLEKGDETLVLRNARGVPAWSVGRRER